MTLPTYLDLYPVDTHLGVLASKLSRFLVTGSSFGSMRNLRYNLRYRSKLSRYMHRDLYEPLGAHRPFMKARPE